jgi:predicted DNA-binding transcriptional regulator AlpA
MQKSSHDYPQHSLRIIKMAARDIDCPLRSSDAAAYVGMSASTLAKMRMRGDGPPYIKSGRRIVVYLKHDLDVWLSRQRRRCTRVPIE